MAKKNTTPVTVVTTPAYPFLTKDEVTVKDLVAHFNMDGKKLRALIRSQGFRAPATGLEGMAPQAKYTWSPDSKNLKKILSAIESFIENENSDEADAE